MDLNSPFLKQAHLLEGGIWVQEMAPVHMVPRDLTLVFLHGAYQGAWVYSDWQAFFAVRGWRSLALSLRGHPGSKILSHVELLKTELHHYVDDVGQVVHWADAPVVLVGHSMGGVISQSVAQHINLTGLILLTTGAPAGIGASRPKDLPSHCVSVPHYDQVRRHMFIDISPVDYAQFYARLVVETPTVMNLTGRGRVVVDPYKISCPVFAIDAEFDRNQFGASLAQYYNGDYQQIPNMAHAIMLGTQRHIVAEVILQWLYRRLSGFV